MMTPFGGYVSICSCQFGGPEKQERQPEPRLRWFPKQKKVIPKSFHAATPRKNLQPEFYSNTSTP
jgi:hypothetical protein